jgi:hypothetical protein
MNTRYECTDCHVPKPADDFYTSVGFRRQACKECEKRKRKERYSKTGSKAEIDWGMIASPLNFSLSKLR